MNAIVIAILLGVQAQSLLDEYAVVDPGGGGGGGATYLVQENCEGMGVPAGWTDSGTLNWDYTSTVLQGTESVSINGLANSFQTFADQSDAWLYFMFRKTATPGSRLSFASLRDNSATALAVMRIGADNTVSLFTNGGDSTTSVGVMANNTTYHVWIHFVSGGTSTLAFSTDGIKPTSGDNFVSRTSQSANVQRVRLESAVSISIYDRVLVDDAVIGDNP